MISVAVRLRKVFSNPNCLFSQHLNPVLSVMSEYQYILMPHYVPNEYPNIFGCNIFTEQISEYICIPEIARIQI